MKSSDALNKQFQFIKSFYLTAEPALKALMRKHNPQVASENLRLIEEEKWQEAAKGLEVLGQCSLALVSKAIQDYLREFIGSERSKTVKGSSWFDKYCNALEERTSFKWPAAPVTRHRIEQINLCRNDFMHDSAIDASQPLKSDKHFKKQPISRFDDPAELAVRKALAQMNKRKFEDLPGPLTVSRSELFKAIADAEAFCAFVDEQTFNGDKNQ